MINSLLWLYGIQPNTYVSGQLVDVNSDGSRKNAKPRKCLKMRQTPQRPVHALLLECSRKGRGGVSWERHHHRGAPGREHQGKPLRPMREKQNLLHSSCYLVARWNLVWASSPNRCVSLTARKSTPQRQTKESVA